MFEKYKNLYEYYVRCDNQQQYKDLVESDMVSTPEGLTGNSSIDIGTSGNLKKPSGRKSLS